VKHFATGIFLTLFLLTFPHATLAQLPPLQPLKGTPAPPTPKDPKKFTFILAGDNRPDKSMCPLDGKKSPCPPTDTVKKIFENIKKKSPAFVLWTGDVISGKDPDSPQDIHDEYKDFLQVAASGNAAVYNAPGNHEMNDKSNCPNSTMLDLYLKDTSQAQPYGSFDYGDSHFIALDSDEDTPTTSDSCNCSKFTGDDKPPGYISKTQMDALIADLSANAKKAHIFIFLHRPLEAYKQADQLCPANVAQMQTLFQQYPNVSYVVAGHEHLYYNLQGATESAKFYDPPPTRNDPDSSGPYYLVSGGAGAPLKSIKVGGEKKKSFYHYLIFNVDHAAVSVQLEPIS